MHTRSLFKALVLFLEEIHWYEYLFQWNSYKNIFRIILVYFFSNIYSPLKQWTRNKINGLHWTYKKCLCNIFYFYNRFYVLFSQILIEIWNCHFLPFLFPNRSSKKSWYSHFKQNSTNNTNLTSWQHQTINYKLACKHVCKQFLDRLILQVIIIQE